MPLGGAMAALVVGALVIGLVAWLIRSKQRERRRARAAAQMAARYRRWPPQARRPDPAPKEPVTVEDLIARIRAEGRPVRLNWDDEEQARSSDEEWPTGLLPRLPRSSLSSDGE